jgi:hypothetical protein
MIHQLRFAEIDHFSLAVERVTDNTIVEVHVLREQRFLGVESRNAAEVIPRQTKTAEAKTKADW